MITLTQGNIAVTAGVFKSATCFECIAAGNLIFTFDDGNTQTVGFVAGDKNYVNAKSIQVSTGTFNIGYDNNNAYR